MQQIDLNNWTEFKSTIDDIRNRHGYHEYAIENNQTYKSKNTVLFRGQGNATWSLQTTLERRNIPAFSVTQYVNKSTRVVHELESYTGNSWNLPDFPDLVKEIKQDKVFGFHIPMSLYKYWIYLRHHGYPSPLLDWSESPFIAAYFAMCDLKYDEPNDDKRVAVFAYIDKLGEVKSFDGGPVIQVRGPFVSTHKRHFIQQAWYTTSTNWLSDYEKCVFCSHHGVFEKNEQNNEQDLLIKITIPIAERRAALKELLDYNINHFTLFQTEDSLAKALSIKEFDISDIFS
jgi:hypothetical protein